MYNEGLTFTGILSATMKKYKKPQIKTKKIKISLLRKNYDFMEFLNVYATCNDVCGCGNCWP